MGLLVRKLTSKANTTMQILLQNHSAYNFGIVSLQFSAAHCPLQPRPDHRYSQYH